MKRITMLMGVLVLLSCSVNEKRQSTIATDEVNYDSLKVILETMRKEDQDIRRILIDSVGFDSPNSGQYIKKMMDVDSINQEKIKLILRKYGWIEKSKIGEKAADAFFYTVQHADLELMEEWFPEFKKLAEKGEANPRQCAMMEDRLLMWKGKKQIYGTQAADFREDKKMAIWPIEDVQNVNERRKNIGFESTVEEYAKVMDVLFNIDEKLPEYLN